MHKNFFHNNKSLSENKNKTTQISKVDTKGVVDINMLLNRVKIEEKNETKRKIIFFSFATLALSLFGTFIAIIR
jgi:hypothetical protein|tara:strand:+ start:583 stop:804 length:222 start_codon:yes stop_codon:yes gene_type:complete